MLKPSAPFCLHYPEPWMTSTTVSDAYIWWLWQNKIKRYSPKWVCWDWSTCKCVHCWWYSRRKLWNNSPMFTTVFNTRKSASMETRVLECIWLGACIYHKTIKFLMAFLTKFTANICENFCQEWEWWEILVGVILHKPLANL